EYISLKNLDMTDNWNTIIDNDAEGLSKNCYLSKNFLPEIKENLSSSKTWATSIDIYRWQKKEILVGDIDTTDNYFIVLDSIQGNNLLWINGKLADKTIAYEQNKIVNITKYLKQNTKNFFITRNENNLKNGGGIDSIWITKEKSKKKLFAKTEKNELITLNHILPSYHDSLIIYETFIRNISPNGTFDGMYYRIPYLKRLGINMVWLMPIHPIGRVNRKDSLGCPYSVRDYFDTNPNYGTKEQFTIMNNRMKQNDIKLIIDAVVNHTAWDNPLFYKHSEYYTHNDSGKIISPLKTDWTDVADLNYENKELRKYITSYFNYWLVDMKIDGFRCDVSEMVPMDFWNDLRKNFKSMSKRPFMLAEGAKTENLTNGFDAVYGWDLYYTFQDIHKDPSKTDEIYNVLIKETQKYPNESEIMHFAENHDTPRAAKSLGNEDHNLALFFIFTAPGIPMIYCGEELGNTKRLNLFEKTTIDWTIKNRKTYNLVKDLTHLRISSENLLKGNINKINDVDFIAGFSRTYNGSTWNIIGNYDSISHIYKSSPDSIIYSDKNTKITENGILLSAKGYCIFK
ncbi:MAG: alpha-amylase family glycosyl hydrolase, partial [Candidatus Marinimicrobia bacterium]|nr:alpha-amylase family glycosyl hydrolase [Candidatus Neomarinimicrobiota bacterium]